MKIAVGKKDVRKYFKVIGILFYFLPVWRENTKLSRCEREEV